jgi:hypothetical protein
MRCSLQRCSLANCEQGGAADGTDFRRLRIFAEPVWGRFLPRAKRAAELMGKVAGAGWKYGSPEFRDPSPEPVEWIAPKLGDEVRIRPSQGLLSAILKYGGCVRCARNPSVAVGQICALFPEMNVALESPITTPGSSCSHPEGGSNQLQPRPSGVENVRLRLLRQHDVNRPWHSARERRVCMLCGSEFEGVQIRVCVRAGKPVFGCPEPGCRGSLPHFAASGNPLLDEAAWSDWMRPALLSAPAADEEAHL